MKMEDFRKIKMESIEKGIKKIEEQMVNKIFEYLNNGSSLRNCKGSLINCYTIVQVLSDQGDYYSKQLLDYCLKTIEKYILECSKILSLENNNFIEEFFHYTEKINTLIYWMYKIFRYLERFYIKAKMGEKTSLSTLSMNLYKSLFFEKFKKKVISELDKFINEERNGKLESENQIKKIFKLFDELEFEYPQIVVENKIITWKDKDQDDDSSEIKKDPKIKDLWVNEYFLEDTRKFVEEKAKNDLQKMTELDYILSIITYFDKEYEILNDYIDPKYHNKINEINYQYLINNPLKEIIPINNFVKDLLEMEKSGHKNNLYKLIKLIPKTIDPIISEFDIYIKNKLEELLKNEELKNDYKKFIVELIKLKKEMDIYVKEHYKNNIYLQNINNQTFSSFLKKDIFSKQLSHYIDYCMRKGFSGKSQEEIDATLNDIISLFKCLDSKLVFQNESNKNMSERLLNKASVSIVNEQKFISKLKQEVGVTYVKKMTEMINDLEKNKKNDESYKSLDHKGSPNGIKFNVTVISQNNWEIKNQLLEKIIIPKFLSTCLEDFENFYLNKYEGQKLIWCLGLSKVEIQYLYLENKNISISTLPQLLTLLLLEKKEELSLEVISQLLGCQSSIIINDIQGLIYNPSFNPNSYSDKGIIIGNFDGETKEFKESDKISINKNFICSKVKFNTLPLSKKKSVEQIKKEEIEEQKIIRKYEDNILQATLTRILKSRIGQKTSHLWLVEETAKQIDLFRAQPQQIKENIEKLIEKKIIERSEEDRACYEYIA